MAYPVDYLIKNSRLPGPRANLELLYAFTQEASEQEIMDSLNVDKVIENSPEEFVLTCGVAASIYHASKTYGRVEFDYQKYANHWSWRVREGVCIGFQRSKAFLTPNQMVLDLQILSQGTPLEVRTYIATLCEPCLLNNYIDANWLLSELYTITLGHFDHNDRIEEPLKVLKKALAYCWSVALCGDSAKGTAFEKLLKHKSSKHIQWIMKENLKKKRLEKLDKDWVISLLKQIE